MTDNKRAGREDARFTSPNPWAQTPRGRTRQGYRTH